MYLVDGRRYATGGSELQHALAAAYVRRLRPVCLCADPHAPLYIARLGAIFMLKRMPFTGGQHAIACPHYEASEELSGMGQILGTAISESPDTGMTQLRVDFSLSKGATHAVPQAESADRGVASGTGAALTLRGLAHYLWREAELTRWRPGFDGKRTWGVVRSHLLTASSNKNVKGSPLTDVLYVPEAFTVAGADAIRARRKFRFDMGLRRSTSGPARKMILVGELKEVLPARIHFSAIIKHAPDMPFFMSSDLHRRTMRQFDCELSLWAGNPECHLLVVATFGLTDWGQPAIDEICLVLASAQWIPLVDGFDKLLIDRLVRDRRAFDKSLGFNSRLPPGAISAVLLDATSGPVPLAIDRDDIDDQNARSDVGLTGASWRWQVHGTDMPALPA
ncbi:DUF1173 family protein [Rhizobacter sp. Root404]|uniref:DUF1173 family protein n=1 Tax=Rhizobacter sp. Root404 TaxID=1736528 RepID=UPI0009E7F7CF|nr:DUF1173 family protein [Rhizobacter sp. Root404]